METISTPAPTFRSMPFMGVIRVNEQAATLGYTNGHPDWINLGQGQPEVGEIPGAPPRPERIAIDPDDHAYGPVEGLTELREAVADHYNRLYRADKASKYTMENVAVAAGGRLALSRCGAALEAVRLGYFTPDYTAYEDLMTTFDRIKPTWIELPPENGFRITPDALEARVERDGIDSLLISNPCNPTGVVIEGDELAAWADMARRRGCTLLMDEFYSHFVYAGADGTAGRPVSTAAYIDDVNEDPIVIFDGLTKCFRYPGWRIGWVVAPRRVIRTLTASGSFLDGGASRPMQRAAIDILQADRADQETDALRRAFAAKRRLVVERLEALGVEFPGRPDGTFYAFGSVKKLPAPLNDGEVFMREAMAHKVLVVPGAYFDVNPGHARSGTSRLAGFVRFSFGPPYVAVEEGLRRLERLVSEARAR